MANRPAFGVDEWYHCYSRGVDKRRTFESQADFRRFVQLLYLCNSDKTIHRSDLFTHSHEEIFAKERGVALVAIAAYALMPNHFHLLIKERVEGGISMFMQKVGISYAMYFNIKNERVGNVFVKPFRSKHVSDDRYLQYLAQYIHLNPAELFESGWKEGKVRYTVTLERQLMEYAWCSLQDYYGANRPERSIIDLDMYDVIKENLPSLRKVLDDAIVYQKELSL